MPRRFVRLAVSFVFALLLISVLSFAYDAWEFSRMGIPARKIPATIINRLWNSRPTG